jgi:Hemerythrin HHE cation binding domain/Polyketide cyclase / dehydrase and lipid transport
MTKTDPNAPADTRLMGIIHEALRRDLRRTHEALTATPLPARRQREALAGHLGWMMQFLHAHHATEDDGLYPLVRQRNPQAADLLDQMHADHAAISPAIAAVERCALDYRRDPDRRLRLLAAIEQLQDVLLPHLRREEDEVMPVVAAAITDGELRRWDEEANIKPKSLRQLGPEGHWIIDSAGPDDRDLVLHLVPPVPRFILLHGFAHSYRRHSTACWGHVSPSRRQVQKQGHIEVDVDAAPDAVWEVVRDVTRIGEWSHECVGAEWLDGATKAVPGVRFRGRNRNGIWRWGRLCEIVDVQPSELVWRTVPTRLYPDSSEWRIKLHPTDKGTRIEQTFRVLKAPRLLEPIYATIIPSHRDRIQALTADLQRLGALAARPPANADTEPPPADEPVIEDSLRAATR